MDTPYVLALSREYVAVCPHDLGAASTQHRNDHLHVAVAVKVHDNDQVDVNDAAAMLRKRDRRSPSQNRPSRG